MIRALSLTLVAALALPITGLVGCSADQGIDDGSDDGGEGSSGDSGGDSGGDEGTGGDDGGNVTDAGDDIDSAAVIEFTKDSLWGDALSSDAINPAGDRDFYRVDATEGLTYLFAAAADQGAEEGEPDTVLRVYNQDGELLAENDDMPLRLWGTDSGLFFQATYTGPYYVEILEWSDWAAYEGGNFGGAGFNYELWGMETSHWTDVEDNNTAAEADALVDGKINQGWYIDPFTENLLMFFGDLNSETDVDVWHNSFSESYWYFWTFWPGPDTNADFVMSLYDGDGGLVAQSGSPEFTDEGTWFDDHGIFLSVKPEQDYYLEVSSASGASGAGTFYPGFSAGYTADALDTESQVSENPVGLGETMLVTESTNTAGYYYSAIGGNLGSDNTSDHFKVLAGDVGGTFVGQYVTAYLQSSSIGALLDAKITIYADDASTVLFESTDAPDNAAWDPEVWDAEVGDQDMIYISVTSEALGDHEDSNYYILSVRSHNQPVN